MTPCSSPERKGSSIPSFVNYSTLFAHSPITWCPSQATTPTNQREFWRTSQKRSPFFGTPSERRKRGGEEHSVMAILFPPYFLLSPLKGEEDRWLPGPPPLPLAQFIGASFESPNRRPVASAHVLGGEPTRGRRARPPHKDDVSESRERSTTWQRRST